MTETKISGTISKEEVLARLHQLPMLSVVVQEVIKSLKDDYADRGSLAGKISQDQGLSAKVLQVANSSFYGLSRKVGSIQDAALVMGFNSIRSLALSAGFVLIFPHTANTLFDRRIFWMRSFRVACYAQALAKSLGLDQQVAFTVGMFHDIGQLVLDVCIPEQFIEILELQHSSELSLMEVEQSKLGFDHALIGAEMAKRWNFPHEIEQAIRSWRTPEQEPFEIYSAIVYVAVLLEDGLREEQLIDSLPKTLCDQLKLTWDRIKAGIPESEQLDEVANQVLQT